MFVFTFCTKVFMDLLVIRETARGSGRVRVFLVLLPCPRRPVEPLLPLQTWALPEEPGDLAKREPTP